jgi:fatty-acyl-CoA synthase
VWAGSSVLPAHLIDAFHKRGVPVCNVYGSTETGPFSIALPPAQARTHVGACGWPARSGALVVEVQLAAQQDGVGELCIRAPNVAQHYWPAISTLDADGFFHTGDLARRAADGSYTVVGRAKDMLISGGENIYPAEIENLLAAHPRVAECAVIGLPDAQWGEAVVACVVMADSNAKTGAKTDAETSAETVAKTAALQAELATLLAQHIARYKLPRRWVWLHALPKTALGKVQKDKLQHSLQAELKLY